MSPFNGDMVGTGTSGLGFHDRLRSHAASGPARQAIVGEGVSIDYAALLARVEAGAAELVRQGVGLDAAVGLLIADEVEHLIATFVLMAVGAAQITLASHDSPALREAIADQVRLTHVLALDDVAPLPGRGHLIWRPSASSASSAPEGAPTGRVYLKTSGTTGDMNIVEFTEAQIAAQAGRHSEYAEERLLRLASVEHNNSKRHRLYCAWQGGTNVFRPAVLHDVAAFCRTQGVTCLDISRMHASDLATRSDNAALANVKLRTGGSAIPIDVRRRVEARVTPRLYVRYAATECGAIAMAGPGEHDEAESVGRPLPGVELEIVDAEGNPLPVGTTGHIRLRAPGMAQGYFDSPGDTARRFRDGWFWAGDMGMLRADGSLVVQGRKDDMMILNGLNIFPAEIEQVLERHPAVRQAAALPLASGVHGQIPVAAVELAEDATISARDLEIYARERLALRAPRRILIMPALPRNSQGKIVRREIAAAFEAARSQR